MGDILYSSGETTITKAVRVSTDVLFLRISYNWLNLQMRNLSAHAEADCSRHLPQFLDAYTGRESGWHRFPAAGSHFHTFWKSRNIHRGFGECE